MMKCKEFQNQLANVLLDETPGSAVKSPVRDHLAVCAVCSEDLAGLRKTMNLLDAWTAPEPSAYFDQKMAVLLREEQANAPASWFEKIRERLLLNTSRQFRPMMVGALALLVVVGGGSFAGMTILNRPATGEVQASATVNDLQILDKNAQAIDQMDQLLQDDGENDSTSGQPAS